MYLVMATIAFTIFVVILEIITGVAVIGWQGDRSILEREKAPYQYWIAIIAQVMIGIPLPLFFYMVMSKIQ